MPMEPTSSSGRRPIRSIQRDRHERDHDVGDAGDHGDGERVLSLKPTACHSDDGVVEDHVDADELLEDREPMPTQTIGSRPRPSARAGPCWTARSSCVEARLDLARPARVDVAVLGELAEHLAGLVVLALGDQVARRLGDRAATAAVDHGRDGAGEEHPAPGVQAEPERARPAPPADVASTSSDEQRDEDAGDDRQLLQRAEPAADARPARSRRCRRARSPRRRRRRGRRRGARGSGPRRLKARPGAERADEEEHARPAS